MHIKKHRFLKRYFKKMLNEKERDRGEFGISYLKFSEFGCEAAINQKKSKAEENYIYIPILYNIKHGLEILLKKLRIILKEKNKLTHNILELFEMLKGDIKKIKISKELANAITKDIGIKGFIFTGKSCEKLLDELYIFVKKYYYLEILKDKIKKNFNMEDTENTALKYPENSLKINLNYNKIGEEFKEIDFKQILSDITKIQIIFYKLHIILTELTKKNKLK